MKRNRTKRQAGQVWPHLLFSCAAGPAKMLVGELPKPAGLRDKVSQSPGRLRLLSAARAIAPGPYFPARPCGRADGQCSP